MEKYNDKKVLLSNIRTLNQSISKIVQTNDKINECNKFISLEKLVIPISEKIANKTNVRNKIIAIKNLIGKYTDLARLIKYSENEHTRLSDLLAKEDIKICPFCGTKLKKNEIHTDR